MLLLNQYSMQLATSESQTEYSAFRTAGRPNSAYFSSMIEASPLLLLCVLISSMSFVFYGWGCITSARIKLEFRRYRLERYRRLVGLLQLTGSAGLIAGLWIAPLGAAAALGLVLLMAMGLVVRKRLRDAVIQMVPAGGYLILNAYLGYAFLNV